MSGGNPYNERPTVRLLDPTGAALGQVSQREAVRMLRAGAAELVFEVPPAVRQLGDPAPVGGARGQFLSARRCALYGNVSFEARMGRRCFTAMPRRRCGI